MFKNFYKSRISGNKSGIFYLMGGRRVWRPIAMQTWFGGPHELFVIFCPMSIGKMKNIHSLQRNSMFWELHFISEGNTVWKMKCRSQYWWHARMAAGSRFKKIWHANWKFTLFAKCINGKLAIRTAERF